MILRAQQTGVSRYIGEGLNLTSTIHVDALADLYLKAVINESAAGIYNAASDEVVCSRDTAHLISKYYGAGIKAMSWPIEEAREALGDLADLSLIECIVSSNRARSELSWYPVAQSLTSELASGSYCKGPLIPYHM